MAKKVSGKKTTGDEEKIFSLLCYLISIIGVLIVLLTKKERTNFSLYHAKQGLVLFIVEIIISIIASLFMWIPFIGWLIYTVLWILMLVLVILGSINSLKGETKELPIIGKYARKFKF